MNYIKFEHSGGIATLNLARVFRFSLSGTTLTIYSDATANVSFSFGSASDAARIVRIIEKISQTIDLDALAEQ